MEEDKKEKRPLPKGKKIGFGCLGIFVLFIVIAAVSGGKEGAKETGDSLKNKADNLQHSAVQKKSPDNAQEKPKIVQEQSKYQIVYIAPKVRYDGGKDYYVLIDTVDLSNDSFKTTVKKTIDKIVKEKGSKISIEFFDSREALDIQYKQYGDMSLGRPLNNEENSLLGSHYIANFSGQLATNIYNNSLGFFPATFSNNTTVGKYVGTIEYNPTK